MPTFRSDLEAILPYRPGRPIGEVMREYGIDEVVKLASNENPLPPFPEVQAAVAAAAAGLNRYPDNDTFELTAAIAGHLDVDPARVWTGGGTNTLMLATALAVGGPGTSAVYAWPSFGLYRSGSQIAHTEGIEGPLDAGHRHDLDRMRAAVRADTTIVYVCNPNNPTGTHVAAKSLFAFVDSIPDRVLVVVDEAYCEYAQAVDYHTALPLTRERENVLVARTFSKVYGLAGLRCGYMVGAPATLAELRRVQLPFTVGSLAQVAAVEALRHQDRVAERAERNAAGLKLFFEELAERGIPFADSQANFVYLRPGDDGEATAAALLPHGVIVRPMGDPGWIRVTVGTDAENRAFFRALDAVRGGA